ncbi:MAG: efflux RND transporter permease subunit, partial [Gammaproteobacteria bacterium]|nr:efflux RND transporter permease subunit [Gammaproteobacteria bacterium]
MLLIILFGIIALNRLPIQLIPNVEQPLIQISTSWRAAAPEEVEAEILEPQEDALRGVPGLKKMESAASRGRSSINLTFAIDIDLQRALIEVMNRLNRVPNYPPDADEPVIYVGQDQFGAAIAWFALRPQDGMNIDISAYQDFVEDVIQTRIERVKGISKTDAYGGRAHEVRITFDPYLAAAYGIDIPTLARIASNNTDTSGGFNEVGRRQYTVRYTGKYQLREFGDMVLSWREGNPVRLRDIAEIDMVLTDRTGIMRMNGDPAIAFNAQPAENVNVLDVMTDLKRAIVELNDGPVGRAGLKIVQVYDETIYIKQSISMLRNNLILGIMLSIGVLWWFMRRLRVTMIVAIAIPVSLFASFALLDAGGRTLNIISLAGMAFAIGMVLDAAIIVMENIVRLRESGRTSEEASIVGATQVWGALLASTATTVAIFLPVVFLRDTAGQLFS